MSRLIFNGSTHRLSLLRGDYDVVGTWEAYNNVDSTAPLKKVLNGIYTIQDKTVPFYHKPNAEGSYGLHGIIHFYVEGHAGVGVHSGRAHAKHNPGPQYSTMGCIRTTDEAMSKIKEVMASSPLTTIEVKNNSGPSPAETERRAFNPIRSYLL